MAGPVLIVVALLFLPVLMGMAGAVLAAILGWSVKANVDSANEGSELLDLNT
jgi:predicted PurR-regulated permease PerM